MTMTTMANCFSLNYLPLEQTRQRVISYLQNGRNAVLSKSFPIFHDIMSSMVPFTSLVFPFVCRRRLRDSLFVVISSVRSIARHHRSKSIIYSATSSSDLITLLWINLTQMNETREHLRRWCHARHHHPSSNAHWWVGTDCSYLKQRIEERKKWFKFHWKCDLWMNGEIERDWLMEKQNRRRAKKRRTNSVKWMDVGRHTVTFHVIQKQMACKSNQLKSWTWKWNLFDLTFFTCPDPPPPLSLLLRSYFCCVWNHMINVNMHE